MSDVTEDAVMTEWAEQPVDSSGAAIEGKKAAEGAPEGTAKETVTENALLSQLRGELDERDRKILQQVQSGIDKADRRITDRLRSDFTELDRSVVRLKAAGIEIDDAKLKELKQSLMLEEIGGEPVAAETSDKDPAQETKPGDPQTPDAAKSPVLATAYALMQEANTFIEKEDVEAALIDFKTKSITEFLDSVKASIAAKQKRLSGASEDDEGEEPSDTEDNETDTEKKAADAAARNPSTGVSKGKVAAGSRGGMSGYDLIKRGYKKTS